MCRSTRRSAAGAVLPAARLRRRRAAAAGCSTRSPTASAASCCSAPTWVTARRCDRLTGRLRAAAGRRHRHRARRGGRRRHPAGHRCAAARSRAPPRSATWTTSTATEEAYAAIGLRLAEAGVTTDSRAGRRRQRRSAQPGDRRALLRGRPARSRPGTSPRPCAGCSAAGVGGVRQALPRARRDARRLPPRGRRPRPQPRRAGRERRAACRSAPRSPPAPAR